MTLTWPWLRLLSLSLEDNISDICRTLHVLLHACNPRHARHSDDRNRFLRAQLSGIRLVPCDTAVATGWARLIVHTCQPCRSATATARISLCAGCLPHVLNWHPPPFPTSKIFCKSFGFCFAPRSVSPCISVSRSRFPLS